MILPCLIQAVNFSDDSPLWSYSCPIDNKEIDPYGLCYDSQAVCMLEIFVIND